MGPKLDIVPIWPLSYGLLEARQAHEDWPRQGLAAQEAEKQGVGA